MYVGQETRWSRAGAVSLPRRSRKLQGDVTLCRYTCSISASAVFIYRFQEYFTDTVPAMSPALE